MHDGMKLGEVSIAQSRKSFDKFENLDSPIKYETGLAASIKDNNLRNPRPKTRGEPLLKNLESEQPTCEVSSKN